MPGDTDEDGEVIEGASIVTDDAMLNAMAA
jgi:hypothetical protein